MSMATLERAIVASARFKFNNRKLRVKDIQEWSTGKIEPGGMEVTEFIDDPGVWVTIKKEDDKRVKQT